MLEDTLRMAHGMWSRRARVRGDARGAPRSSPARLLNSPQSISRPRVPIMIGGGGEKKTLRLVAQYGDACNVFGSPEGIARKYRILDEHCAAVGRDPAEIERSTLQDVNLSRESGRRAESAAQVVDRFGDLADAGAEHIILSMPEVHDPEPDRDVRRR